MSRTNSCNNNWPNAKDGHRNNKTLSDNPQSILNFSRVNVNNNNPRPPTSVLLTNYPHRVHPNYKPTQIYNNDHHPTNSINHYPNHPNNPSR